MKIILTIILSSLILSRISFAENITLNKDFTIQELNNLEYAVDQEGLRPIPARWKCVAKNRSGRRFRARGYNLRRARSRALRRCFNHARTCRITRCRRTHRW